MILNLRRVRLERSTAEGWVGAVLSQLPGTDASLHDLVGVWGRINKVGDPSVPVHVNSTSRRTTCHPFMGSELTSRAQCGRRRILPPCNRPIVFGLSGKTPLALRSPMRIKVT